MAGKTCLITGAAQGIGRSIAEAFLAEGAEVIATDLRAEGLDQLPASPALRTHVLDVTDESGCRKAAQRFPEVSVLVNCAGFVATGSILGCTAADFDRSMAINVRSMFLTISSFLPNMVERGNGSIINIASVVSSVMAAPERFAYGTSKAAVVGLTMSVARDVAARGVRCNAISPGTVATPSLNDRLTATGDFAKAQAQFISRQLMGRLGRATEIAAVAVLMASDEAPFMTGSNVVVDGGMSL
jgi:2-keto-3-deoxy-L-fuconate dehydrogenase